MSDELHALRAQRGQYRDYIDEAYRGLRKAEIQIRLIETESTATELLDQIIEEFPNSRRRNDLAADHMKAVRGMDDDVVVATVAAYMRFPDIRKKVEEIMGRA